MAREAWRIEMLGGLVARRGDNVLTHFETRKVGALLALLALHVDRTHPRERLAEQLWPDEDWDAIRNRLRHALSSLRRDLEPEGTPDGAVIVADRSEVRLNPDAIVTDVAEFDEALKTAASTTDPESRGCALRAAIELYRGDLLPGYFEEGLVAERDRLEEAYSDALLRCARLHADSGDLNSAIDFARRALARDPLREDAHCELMRLFAAMGRKSDAIRQYRDLERRFREDLGAAPSPSTRDQFDLLLLGSTAGAVVTDPDPARGTEPPREDIEPDGGAVPLDSRFYIVRPTDGEFQAAVNRNDSIVLVKGPRQVGKTSLLARSLQRARESGVRVVLTDLQKVAPEQLDSPASLFRTFGEMIADQLDLDLSFDGLADDRRGWNVNFERFMRREILRPDEGQVVWALDEVDRLFGCCFSSVVFGLFRSWHNERSLNPGGPWSRLTIAMAYATEAHLFISDLNQSPFNVGTRLVLDDFTRGEVSELNRRYGSPISTDAEFERVYALVGGCPYLVRRGLHTMAERGTSAAELGAEASLEDGPFGDHLRRMWAVLKRDRELCDEMRGVLAGRGCTQESAFYRLLSAGVIVGRIPAEASPRCDLYRIYLERKLAATPFVEDVRRRRPRK